MKEFPDDELDKLFRKSAEELDSDFDPQDWNALKKRLDENDGRTPGPLLKKWWPAGMLALLMIAGLTAYFLAGTDGENRTSQLPVDKTERSAERIKNVQGENLAKDSTRNSTGNEMAALAGSNAPGNAQIKTGTEETSAGREDKSGGTESRMSGIEAKKKYSIAEKENKKALPRRGSETGGVYLEPNHSIGRKGDGAIISENNAERRSGRSTEITDKKVNKAASEINAQRALALNENNHNAYTPESKFSNRTGKEEIKEQKAGSAKVNEEQSRLNFSVYALKSRTMAWKQTSKMPDIAKTETPWFSKPAEKVKESEKEPEPKFAIRFGYSPDLSGVGVKNFTKPGTAVSLLIEYSFLRRLYFQTGLIRSGKNYNAKAGEYEWPSSWNDQKVLPTSVDALCKVVELPLNLRFDISRNERSRWFAGAGASSYYMQKERYDYNYPPHTYNIIWKDYETSTGWYWLSHLNASAGYEYRFSKKLSLLAEPYVRIPVKKVGYGKVDLFSAGMWFSIRYTPVFKK